MQSTAQRDDIIDCFRALSVFIVVGVHSVVTGFSPPVIQTLFDAENYSLLQWNIGAPFFRGHLGVEVFFFISGYVMMMVARRDIAKSNSHGTTLHFSKFATSFWTRRFLRIYPLFFLHISLQALLYSPPTKDIISSYLLISNFSPTTVTSVSPVMWSLAVEVQFYLIFPFLFWAIRDKEHVLPYLVVLTFPFIFLMRNQFVNPSSSGLLFVISNNLPAYMFLFLFGMTLYAFGNQLGQIWKKYNLKYGLIPVAFLLLFWNTPRSMISYQTITFLYLTVITLALIMAMWDFSANGVVRGNFAAFVSFIGRASYSIYLFHNFGIRLIHNAFSGHIGAMPIAFLSIFAGLLSGVIAYFVFERPIASAIKTFRFRLALSS